jgi:hypothetical protein
MTTPNDGRCPHATGTTTQHCAEAERLAREVERLRAQLDFIRNLETSGGDIETGTLHVQIDPRGGLIGSSLGNFVDAARFAALVAEEKAAALKGGA